MAVNCWLTSSAMVAGLGEITRPVAWAEVTLSVVVAETFPELAVMVVVPAETPVASPLVGEVSLIVATVLSDELQLTLPVMICVLLSL